MPLVNQKLLHLGRFFSSVPSNTTQARFSVLWYQNNTRRERGGKRIGSSRSSTFRVTLRYLKFSLAKGQEWG